MNAQMPDHLADPQGMLDAVAFDAPPR